MPESNPCKAVAQQRRRVKFYRERLKRCIGWGVPAIVLQNERRIVKNAVAKLRRMKAK